MQDIQNIPNPDVNSNEQNDFGNHSEIDQNRQNTDVERENEEIPVPPDNGKPAPVEEPPETQKPVIDEDRDGRVKRIV